MNGNSSTITVGMDEAHTHVVFILEGRGAVKYKPYPALRVSAEVLDAAHRPDIDGMCEVQVPGLPALGMNVHDAFATGKSIATIADRLLDEAALEF